LKYKKILVITVLVIFLSTPMFAAANITYASQGDEYTTPQDPFRLSDVDDDLTTQHVLRATSSPDNPPIDPIGEGSPLTVKEYLTNTTSTYDMFIHGTDPGTEFCAVGPASTSQYIPLTSGEFIFSNIRNDSIESQEIEDYTLHSTSFSDLYAQGFNVTSEFEHYYLTQFTIGKLVFFGGGGSIVVEIRNSTAGNLPDNEILATDSFAYGSLGEVTEVAFTLVSPVLLNANHTYFVVVQTTNCDWYYVGDGSYGDGIDDGVACHHDGNNWVLSQPTIPGGETIDFALTEIEYQTVFFASEIELTVNGTQVTDMRFEGMIGGELSEIYDPVLYPNSTGYFNFDLAIDPAFNITLDLNCTLRYLWDVQQTDNPIYNVLNGTKVNWNVTTDILVPNDSDLFRGIMAWYNYSFVLQNQNIDWNGTSVFDSVGTEVTGFCEIQNGSYVNITPAAVEAATSSDGIWVVHYNSPNYLNQVLISPAAEIYNSSDTITVSATLIDNSINSGTASLNFTNPSGETIHTQADTIPIDGVLDFDPFEIPDEISDGNYTILVLFEGNGNSLNEIGFICRNITVDGIEIPPVTTISPDDDTIQSATPITLSVDDGMGVGVDYTQYRIDGGVWTNYTAPFDFSIYGEGMYLVEFNSTDLNGNREQTKSMNYIVDDTSPETAIDPVDLAITSSTPIILTAVDIGGSGLFSIGYRLDGGAWQPYTGSFTFNAGNHVVEYNATDSSGNIESTKSKSYVVDDTTPPVTSITPTVSTIRTDVLITLAAIDDGSGVNRTEYRVDEGEWQNYTTPFTLSNGTHQVEYNSMDNAGNIELVQSKIYVVDDTPPMTTCTPDNMTSISTTTVLTLSAVDSGGAGLKNIAYRIDDGPWITYTTPFVIPYGIHKLQYNSTDQSGNIETTNVLTYTVNDFVHPTTAISPNDESIRSSDQIELIASDEIGGSGVLETWYRIDEGSWMGYVTPIILTVGNYTIEFYSIDVASNTEPITQFNYTVDDTPPSTIIIPDQQYIQPFTSLTLTANDTGGSGISEVYYRIDGGGFSQVWILYDSPFVLDPGFHEVEYYAVDYSGNTESIHLTNYTVDGAAPMSSVNISTSLIDTTTMIEITSSDAISGVDFIKYKLNDGDWWYYTGMFSLYEGDYILYYNATDLAGNVESTQYVSFSVEDTTPPTTEISPSNSTILEGTYIFLSSIDDETGSGVSMILYSINAGSWIVYEDGFVLNENGTYTISYFAMDNADNNEMVDYKIYEVVTELIDEDTGNQGGSAGSGGGIGTTTSFIEVSTDEKDYTPKQRVTITGNLNGDGNYASGKLVFIEYNGNTFNTTTNDDGVFSFAVTSPASYGNYCVTAWFDGDSDWRPSSCMCAFLVVEQDSVLTVDVNGTLEENNTVTINLKLKTDDGKMISGGQLAVVIYAMIETSIEIESLIENDLVVKEDSGGWEVIYETVIVTDEQGNAQLLFIVPTSRDLKIVACYDGYADDEGGYIGASDATFIEGQPKVVDLGILSMTSDVLLYVIGAFVLVGVGGVFAVLQKAGIFFQLRHGELIAFADQMKQMLGKRKTILLDEISLTTGLEVTEVADWLAKSIAEGLLYGLIDIGTNEFIDISYEDEHKLKEMLRVYLKHHKGVFDIHELAKRCKMKVNHLLRWLKILYDSGEINGKVIRSKKDPDRYRYVIAAKVR